MKKFIIAATAVSLLSLPAYAEERVVVSDPAVLWTETPALDSRSSDDDIHTPLGKIQDINAKLDKLAANGRVDQNVIAESVANRLREQIQKEVQDATQAASSGAIKGAVQAGGTAALWSAIGTFFALLTAGVLRNLFTSVVKFWSAFIKMAKTASEQAVQNER